MAIDLNKLIEDSKKRDAEAKAAAEKAQKSAGKTKADAQTLAKYRRYMDYADTLRTTRKTFEDVIKRYASRIARGDKLDVLEQDELNNAVDQYNRIDAAITKAQQDAYNIYTGRTESPKPIAEPVTGKKETPQAARVEMPMGAGTVIVSGTQPSAKDVIKGGTLRTPLPNKPPKKGTAVSGTFDPAAARRGEEASMVGVSPTGTATIGDVIAKASQLYGGIDEIFRTDPELSALLRKAVGDVNDPLDDYTAARFTSELENTKWFKTNAGPIRQRGFYKRQYEDLANQLKKDDPNYRAKLEELDKTSEYGRGLVNAIETVREEVTKQGRQVDEDTIRKIAQDLYDYSNEGDAVKIRNAVLGAGKYALGGVVGGEAGESLTELRKVARANGLDLDTLFSTSVPTWLDRIAKGESVETFKNIIRQTAKTTWKADDRVSSLLDQGVDLDTIYSPYKSLMASTLEIPTSTITFNDLASKGVIGGKDPLNLYDFEKLLRKDTRWQYTKNAREEVSNAALQVLRDFGFQG